MSTLLGVSVGAAQSAVEPGVVLETGGEVGLLEQAEPVASDAASDQIRELTAELEQRDQRIAALQEQLAFLRQSQLASEMAAVQQASNQVLSLEARGILSDEANQAAMDQWRAGYALGGGRYLSAFEQTILPCESGSQPNPDIAVGATDDWGRAQVNRRTWKERFESLTGLEFESNITNPILNGFMSAHIEQEQGLSAWTCWRKR